MLAISHHNPSQYVSHSWLTLFVCMVRQECLTYFAKPNSFK